MYLLQDLYDKCILTVLRDAIARSQSHAVSLQLQQWEAPTANPYGNPEIEDRASIGR